MRSVIIHMYHTSNVDIYEGIRYELSQDDCTGHTYKGRTILGKEVTPVITSLQENVWDDVLLT